jgi:hypothetical protein
MLILTLVNHFDNHLKYKKISFFLLNLITKIDLPIQWTTPLSLAFNWEKFIWSIGEPCDTSTSSSSGVKWIPERISASDNSGYRNIKI